MIVTHSRGKYEVEFLDLKEAATKVGGNAFVITDQNVEAAWGHVFSAWGPALSIPPGESSKSFHELDRCCQWLAKQGANRGSTVIAVGGGVVGDLAGLAAAIYMRGVELVQVPTSLLAMVDSSVGGKVGIDLPQGKNLVGAFYPPKAVFIGLEVLSTLLERELRSGSAEIWKTGFILDEGLLADLEREAITPDRAELKSIVERCVDLKRQIVEEDEFERTGRRAILNFGHTIGHAIEACMEYREILHGEAVAIGMVLEAALGERLGQSEVGLTERVRAGMQAQGLPTELPQGLKSDDLIAAMRRDKKVVGSNLSFSIVTKPGECKLVHDVPEHEVRALLGAK